MRVITFARIKEFAKLHPDSEVALGDWFKKTTKGEWACLSDIRKTSNSVDYVGNNRYVFNIKGDNYRLIVIIIFASKKVYIRFIGTHSEYERIDASNI